MQTYSNYYLILQIEPTADAKTIASAHRHLALKYHPDTNKSPDATLRMQEINEAYRILSDPQKRERFDQYLRAQGQTTQRRAPASAPAGVRTPQPENHPRPESHSQVRENWIPQPANIRISRGPQRLRIVRDWFSPWYIALTIPAVLCDLFFLVNLVRLATSGLLFFLGSLYLMVLALAFTYYVAAGYINRTVIDVDLNSLTIRHGPLPFWRNKRLASGELKLVYYVRNVFYGNGDNDSTSLYRSHELHAITSDNQTIRLLSGLDNREQALFITQELGKFLHIDELSQTGRYR